MQCALMIVAMKTINITIIIFVLIINLIIPPHVLARSRSNHAKPTVAIIPVVESSEENTKINKEFAVVMRNWLKKEHNVLSNKIVDQIVKNSVTTQRVSDGLATALSLIKEGRDAYVLGGHDKAAIDVLESAEELILKKVDPSPNSSNALISSILTRSWVLFENKKPDKARAVLQKLFNIIPNNKINTKGYPRAFRKMANSIKVESSQKGLLKVKSIPASVNVFVNGIYVGATPYSVSLAEGKYIVSLSANGRKSVTKKTTVSSKKPKTVAASLKWDRSKKSAKKLFGGLVWQEASTPSKIALAAHISSATNVDRAIFVATEKKGSSYYPSVQVFDKKYNQAMKVIKYKKKVANLKAEAETVLRYFVKTLKPYLQHDAAHLWREHIDNTFTADHRIAVRPKKPIYKKPTFWAAVGAVVLGGVLTGVLASGGSSQSGSGSVTVGFDDFK